jgi:glycosyltransferase involved in cell wall biosynthesis
VNQIDAARTHERVVIEEEQKWPGWQSTARRVPEEYWQRLKAEWTVADGVVVNSNWSRNALISQGVRAEKITVIPLAYESQRSSRPPRETKELVVLYVGRVVLEKGIPYLFEAARRVNSEGVRFVVAGPVGISSTAVATVPPNVSVLGSIPRDRVHELYRNADVFVLPTLSDGFAITQLEAMAHGLPVIATPNCGEVVSDRVDGRIVPAADAVALAAAIEELVRNRTLLRDMSRRASERVRQFSLDRLAERIDSLLATVTLARCGKPAS